MVAGLPAFDKRTLVENYRSCFRLHGDCPQGVQYTDGEGQRFRFEKLAQVGPLDQARVLDVGCGLGHLLDFLQERFSGIDYTGVDLVAETLARAAQKHPQASFLCRDIVEQPLEESFDYVFICAVFNNPISQPQSYLQGLVEAAFGHAGKGLAFNFISNRANYLEEGMAYHDPLEVLSFCLTRLTRQARLEHHYRRCDTAVFLYPED